MTSILIVDDEESICWGLTRLAKRLSLEAESCSSAEQGLARAAERPFDVVLLDVRLPGMDGLTAIQRFREVLGSIPIITMTAFGDLPTAIQAVQEGAFEYLVKPFSLDQVEATLRQALATSRLTRVKQDVDRAERDREKEEPTGGLVGTSAIMQEVYKQIGLATTSDSPVLLSGESGTGKELAARAIHRFGPRADRPFVAVHVAALSPSLVESELFGHRRGAFTGADADRVGLIQQSHGGTLFLDEVAEIPLEIQTKLLRVLDQGEVTPVGSNEPIPTDFRLISATHQDLLSQVNHGDFRHDLLYRIRTLEIRLPPLRQRPEDIPLLVQHFLGRMELAKPVEVSDEFLVALRARPWPGNVRELQSVVARAATLATGGWLTAASVPAASDVRPADSEQVDLEVELGRMVKDWTRQNWDRELEEPLYEALLKIVDGAIFREAFELSDSQYSAAARRLGIHRTTLKRRLEE